jgi:starch synthase (maltosyl-transferring)
VTASVTLPSIGDLRGRRIVIEDIYPSVDGGRFAIKRVAGEPIEIWADIFRDGHALLAADLLWRPSGANRWSRTAMRPHQNDRWTGGFVPPKPGRYTYAIEAWTDHYASWRRDLLAKRHAGLDVTLELKEGRLLLERSLARSKDPAIADL